MSIIFFTLVASDEVCSSFIPHNAERALRSQKQVSTRTMKFKDAEGIAHEVVGYIDDVHMEESEIEKSCKNTVLAMCERNKIAPGRKLNDLEVNCIFISLRELEELGYISLAQNFIELINNVFSPCQKNPTEMAQFKPNGNTNKLFSLFIPKAVSDFYHENFYDSLSEFSDPRKKTPMKLENVGSVIKDLVTDEPLVTIVGYPGARTINKPFMILDEFNLAFSLIENLDRCSYCSCGYENKLNGTLSRLHSQITASSDALSHWTTKDSDYLCTKEYGDSYPLGGLNGVMVNRNNVERKKMPSIPKKVRYLPPINHSYQIDCNTIQMTQENMLPSTMNRRFHQLQPVFDTLPHSGQLGNPVNLIPTIINDSELCWGDFFENFDFSLEGNRLRYLRAQIKDGIEYFNTKGFSKKVFATLYVDFYNEGLDIFLEKVDTKIGNGGCQELAVILALAFRRENRQLTLQEQNLCVLAILLDNHCVIKKGSDSCLAYQMKAYYQELQDLDTLLPHLKKVKESDTLKKGDFNSFCNYGRLIVATASKALISMLRNKPLDPTRWLPNAPAKNVDIPTDPHVDSFETIFGIINEAQIPVNPLWQHVIRSEYNREGELNVDAKYNMLNMKNVGPDEVILTFNMYSTNLNDKQIEKVESMKMTQEIFPRLLEWAEVIDNDGKSDLRFDEETEYANGVYSFIKVKEGTENQRVQIGIVHIRAITYRALLKFFKKNTEMYCELNLNGPRKTKKG